MIELVFETHATSVDNEDGLASGHWDAPLSALGEKQAVELGHRYPPGTGMDVFCSDLRRSYKTAEIAFGGRDDILIHKDPRLRECDYAVGPVLRTLEWPRRGRVELMCRSRTERAAWSARSG